MDTLIKAFFATCDKFPQNPAIQHKIKGKWVTLTFKEYKEKAVQLALFLRKLGIDRDDKIAILSKNRLEWCLTDLSILINRAISVPLYPTLQTSQIKYILRESDCRIVFLEDKLQVEKFTEIFSELPELIKLVVMDPLGVELSEKVLTFSECLRQGSLIESTEIASIEKFACQAKETEISSIVYTSGTTGQPKGVMLSHKNIISNINNILQVYPITHEDTTISILPLSHVLERTAGFFAIHITAGAMYAFAESIEKVSENIREISPTIVIAVPRLLEKMYVKMLSNVRSGSAMQRWIFEWALKVGYSYARSKRSGRPGVLLQWQHQMAQLLVFSKIHQRLGGRIRNFISGGAPLEPRITEFFEAINIVVLEGYGLTETSPVTNVNCPNKMVIGSVGPSLPDVQVKIAEDGEILVKGPNVMVGYYKNQDATNEVMTQDGWFKTGDLGRIDEKGCLWITDRKKEIIITSGGKNIAPQPIEQRIKASPLIQSVMLIGDRRNFVTAIILPELDNIREQAGLVDIDPENIESNLEVRRLIQEEIKIINTDLPKYEQIKKILIVGDEWSEKTGELTPTMKLKRRVIMEKYKDRIEDLYL